MHFALLDNNFSSDGTSYLFRNPKGFVTARTPADVPAAFERLNSAREDGLYAVGFAAYELAHYFGFETHYHPESRMPLVQFGLFDAPMELSNTEVDNFLAENRGPLAPYLAGVSPEIGEKEFAAALTRIKSHLEAGNSYQVNFTYRIHSTLGGCAYSFYERLREAQPVEYGAFLSFPDQTVLSRSPELFFRKMGSSVCVKPMKGTAPRHPFDPALDAAEKDNLRQDQKQTAENVMIVDLLRNDLGRIAEPGSVTVSQLFDVESYRTVHQMTSTVECRIQDSLTVESIFEALFPCGSITGAPKARTCEIIAETEKSPRGIYTGAIGMITPDNDMVFNVPIRTYSMDRNGMGQFAVGSGITYDSEIEGEYRECGLKAHFFLNQMPDFRVLDCFHYAPETGRRNDGMHLARLEASCRDLGFPYSAANAEQEIAAVLTTTDEPSKIRIEVAKDGTIRVNAVPLGPEPSQPRHVVLSDKRTSSNDIFYRHKTTNRALFDGEFRRYRNEHGIYDVLFLNERGELTEACHHNLFLRFSNTYLTAPLSAGVLDGIGRRLFIAEHGDMVREETLFVEQLYTADEILLVSSIRGICPVTLIDKAHLDILLPEEQLAHA